MPGRRAENELSLQSAKASRKMSWDLCGTNVRDLNLLCLSVRWIHKS